MIHVACSFERRLECIFQFSSELLNIIYDSRELNICSRRLQEREYRILRLCDTLIKIIDFVLLRVTKYLEQQKNSNGRSGSSLNIKCEKTSSRTNDTARSIVVVETRPKTEHRPTTATKPDGERTTGTMTSER